ARRDDLGSDAAIKILRDAWLSPARRDRFASEQRTLAQLNHPLIARLYDADTLPDGTPWFVMEYVDGVPLTDYCRDHASSMPDRLRLFRNVCEAVQHAHGQAIIHRDLKPSNIFVMQDGTIKLLDFGIAKHLDDGAVDSDHTRTGLRLMTPAYAAPEQIRAGRVGIHTDIYSLGVVLYELLTGRLPFDVAHRTPAEVETLIAEHDPVKPSAVARRRLEHEGADAKLPAASKSQWDDLDVLCLTAMHKEPARRYATVDALIRDIDRYLAGAPRQRPLPRRQVPAPQLAPGLDRRRRVRHHRGTGRVLHRSPDQRPQRCVRRSDACATHSGLHGQPVRGRRGRCRAVREPESRDHGRPGPQTSARARRRARIPSGALRDARQHLSGTREL